MRVVTSAWLRVWINDCLECIPLNSNIIQNEAEEIDENEEEEDSEPQSETTSESQSGRKKMFLLLYCLQSFSNSTA